MFVQQFWINDFLGKDKNYLFEMHTLKMLWKNKAETKNIIKWNSFVIFVKDSHKTLKLVQESRPKESFDTWYKWGFQKWWK